MEWPVIISTAHASVHRGSGVPDVTCFRRITIPSFPTTSSHNFPIDFFAPLLAASTSYDRGVGYFTSGWLEENSRGMARFAENGGHARWITSPILDQRDWEALLKGSEAQADQVLKEALDDAIDDLEEALSADTLLALAWLICDGILQMRLACPRGLLDGDFHDKFGVFTDADGDQVAFNGSYNDSKKGSRNYESLAVACDWQSNYERELVQHQAQRFLRLWRNEDPNVRTVPVPTAAVERLVQYRERGPRPYRIQPSARQRSAGLSGPKAIELRDYQLAAIEAWQGASARGILKMATGTGKTITALSAATRIWRAVESRGSQMILVIVCPYQHLVTQWADECRRFGVDPILCFQSRATWITTARRAINQLNAGALGFACLVATNATFRGKPFQDVLSDVGCHFMLVVDEVHNAAADEMAAALPPNAALRLGLSATPESVHDEERDERLLAYFGPSVFEFGLREAIAGGYLSEYYYHPIVVELTRAEQAEYLELSKKIAEKWHADDRGRPSEAVKMLLIQRARILAAAANKKPRLLALIAERNLQESSHNLVYCGEGDERFAEDHATEEGTKRQVDAIAAELLDRFDLTASRYVAETPIQERARILREFANGSLQVLVAIRCLDEGVDVPAIRRAFILASSSNPRQFIQRRGRVLRRAPGKEAAEIFDFIVAPPEGLESNAEFNVERGMVGRELTRVIEFAHLALNGPSALAELLPLRRRFNLLHL